MDLIYRLIYSIYMWFTHIMWWCRRHVEYYYLVGNDGKQYSLTEHNLLSYKHLLVVYYTPNGTRYRFHGITKDLTCNVKTLKSAFKIHEEPKKNKLYAVNATVHDRVHTINAIEFNVIGNEIFTPTFNLWLCLHYLHIVPSEHIDVSYIDDQTCICSTKGPIFFDNDGVHIKNNDSMPLIKGNNVPIKDNDSMSTRDNDDGL
jgi:hypothetical protein